MGSGPSFRRCAVRERPFGGRTLLADTSAWTAIRRARRTGENPTDWTNAVGWGQIITSPVVRLELLHSELHSILFAEIDEMLGLLEEVQITASTFRTAIGAVRDLAQMASGGYHRVGLADALIAASAQERGCGVLHYNARDFDKLARVLVFDSVPLAPPGTFER
jgi:predicted nucleic acid-binding protein